ncbi:unnamed protein product [Schistocephalus solidus]|uniref:C2H2-type domain-containing protein n=1 Tax=Schistocephalus solidus TaxID=70667 RepID=A0A183SJU4_SCHSO|nr:unnamed protein product [Schistocephalus solidus]
MIARVTNDGAVSEAFAVTDGMKQDSVLAPTFFRLMSSAMIMDAYRDERSRIRITCHRTPDGHLWQKYPHSNHHGKTSQSLFGSTSTTAIPTTTTTTNDGDSVLNYPPCERTCTTRIGLVTMHILHSCYSHRHYHHCYRKRQLPAPLDFSCLYCTHNFISRIGLGGHL